MQHHIELGFHGEVVAGEFFAAVGASGHHVGGVPAVFVDGDAGDVRVFPFVAEPPHCEEDVEEIPALVGEPVLMARWVVLVGDCLQDAVGDQLLQPVRKDVAGDLQVALEVVEAADAKEDVADDQQCPSIADNVDGAGDDAVEVFD